ncbi:MAG: UbiA family prenyltransferase [Caldilineaceae bacterium]
MLLGILRLVRLSNSLPAALLVLLGAKLVDLPLLQGRLWLAMTAMWAITAFGYVSNDLTDLAEDQVNKPDRPLPTGVVTYRQAFLFAIGLITTALILSRQLGLLPLGMAIVVLLLLLLYNWKLKGTAGFGNLLIAGLAACALLPGAVAVVGWQVATLVKLLPAALALALFILAREMVKTLEDIPGDQAAGKRTIAISAGVQGTLWLVACCALLLFITICFWFRWRSYSLSSMLLMLLGVNFPLGYTAYYLTLSLPSPKCAVC